MTLYERSYLVLMVIQTVVLALSAAFVAWQLRQFGKSMNYQTYHRHVDQFSRMSQLLLEKPHLNSLFRAEAKPGEDPDIERDCYIYLGLCLGCFENVFVLRQQEWRDEEAWLAWERWFCERWFTLPLFQVFWGNEKSYYVKKFQEYVDDKLRAVPAHSELPATSLRT